MVQVALKVPNNRLQPYLLVLALGREGNGIAMSRQTDRAIWHGVGINRRTLLAAGAATVALGLSSPSAWSQEPVSGGILKLGFSADPAGFDPAKGPSGMSHVVIEQVYSTLMSLDPDAVPIPIWPKALRCRKMG